MGSKWFDLSLIGPLSYPQSSLIDPEVTSLDPHDLRERTSFSSSLHSRLLACLHYNLRFKGEGTTRGGKPHSISSPNCGGSRAATIHGAVPQCHPVPLHICPKRGARGETPAGSGLVGKVLMATAIPAFWLKLGDQGLSVS